MADTETIPWWHADFQEKMLDRFSDIATKQVEVITKLNSLDGRVAKQNGAVAKLQEDGNRMLLFAATHPKDCDGIRGLRNDLEKVELVHRAGLEAVRSDLLRERSDKREEDIIKKATKTERGRWLHGIPKLAYIVIILAVLLVAGRGKEWIEALVAIGKAVGI